MAAFNQVDLSTFSIENYLAASSIYANSDHIQPTEVNIISHKSIDKS